jgi:Tfp pilus assembly protein PilF
MGLALKGTGDLQQAEQWLRFSVELAPERAEFHANLANLLRAQKKYPAAEEAYRTAVRLAPEFASARRGLALTLDDLRRYAEAETECRALLARDPADAEAWTILGMAFAHRDLNLEAESAYRRAIALDPGNSIAHHNLGALLVRLERPEALSALETAGALGAVGYETAYNIGRAALNEGDLDRAEGGFARAVELQPTNIEAQMTLARVRYMRGDPAFVRSLVTAVKSNRDNVPLQHLLGRVLWRAGQLSEAEVFLRDVLTRKGSHARVQSTLSAVLLEQGQLKEAETLALEAAALRPHDQSVLLNAVTVLLARGAAEDAVPFIRAQLSRTPASPEWLAHEATAARLLGTERYRQLYDYDRFVRVFELEAPPGWSSMEELNRALAATLNERHHFSQHPLDQTLRNGTQTSRSLLTDPDPAVRSILKAFEAPIEEYRRSLGSSPDHPLSRWNVGVSQFTGAWSVRLQRNGYHVNHLHPDGMLSSAYYVEIPEEAQDPQLKSGWLKLGEPRFAVRGLTPERFVQPKPGRLVLFPSYMWHGTTPIYGAQTRLTIAFDVRPEERPQSE